MRFATLAACCLLLLSGCTSEGGQTDPGSDPLTCEEGVVHPYENRCATEGEGGEVCHVWIGEGIERDDYIFCTAQTDGRATIRLVFEGSGKVELNMVQGGEVQWTRSVGPGEYDMELQGTPGDMRLTVGFADAVGPVDAWLWG